MSGTSRRTKQPEFVAQAERAFKRVARKLRAEKRQPSTRLNRLKVPFGTAKFCRLRNARYLTWRDAFEVEFEDGIAFLETHAAIRKANKITSSAIPASVELEPETRSGFFVHYDNGQTAEVSGHSSANYRRRNDPRFVSFQSALGSGGNTIAQRGAIG